MEKLEKKSVDKTALNIIKTTIQHKETKLHVLKEHHKNARKVVTSDILGYRNTIVRLYVCQRNHCKLEFLGTHS